MKVVYCEGSERVYLAPILSLVKLEILSASFICFLHEKLGELRSRSLGRKGLVIHETKTIASHKMWDPNHCRFAPTLSLEICIYLSTGSPSLVYKRDAWEISFDCKTGILIKLIKLHHTDLFCLHLWLHWIGFWAILARFATSGAHSFWANLAKKIKILHQAHEEFPLPSLLSSSAWFCIPPYIPDLHCNDSVASKRRAQCPPEFCNKLHWWVYTVWPPYFLSNKYFIYLFV